MPGQVTEYIEELEAKIKEQDQIIEELNKEAQKYREYILKLENEMEEKIIREIAYREIAKRSQSLCNNIFTLAENIETLLKKDEEAVGMSNIGIVISMSCCEKNVILAEMGSVKGQEIAFKSLKEDMEKKENGE